MKLGILVATVSLLAITSTQGASVFYRGTPHSLQASDLPGGTGAERPEISLVFIDGMDLTESVAGEPWHHDFSPSILLEGATRDTIRWSVIDGPSGFEFDDGTGILTGVFPVEGRVQLLVRATSGSVSAERAFHVDVVAPVVVASSYGFTTCGASGRLGPTFSACQVAYAGSSLDSSITISKRGYQNWIVPASGRYEITAVGATGGEAVRSNLGYGGRGASIGARFQLARGDSLTFVVGQKGSSHFQNSNRTGSGGGGSFVLHDDVVLLAAGGGGGGVYGYAWGNFQKDGGDASLVENGGNGVTNLDYCGKLGANGGRGGYGGSGACAGAGSGVFSDGRSHSSGRGGRSILNSDGTGGASPIGSEGGGFGGGGASFPSSGSGSAAGGGGGYSGGGGAGIGYRGFSGEGGGGGSSIGSTYPGYLQGFDKRSLNPTRNVDGTITVRWLGND